MCHTYLHPVVLSLCQREKRPKYNRWFLHNQYCGLQWKGNVWGKGLENSGWRQVRSGRMIWSSWSFCAQRMFQLLEPPGRRWIRLWAALTQAGVWWATEPGEALPVYGSALLSFGRHGMYVRSMIPKLCVFLVVAFPTTLPTAYHISVGLTKLQILIAHNCDL